MVKHHETDEIVAVHAVGPRVAEMIPEATLAVKFGPTVDDIVDAIHPFPTFAESFKHASQAFRGDTARMSCCLERDANSTTVWARLLTALHVNETRMLELYQAEDCPYCEKVREKLMELGVSYVNHNPRTAGGDTRNQQTLEEMETIGGEDQIPFLVDHQHGVSIYESDDIIEHLEENYA